MVSGSPWWDVPVTGVVELGERLRHVVWIGGGSGAGKSTIAAALAARHGLRLYATDDVMADHAGRCVPQDCPQLSAFLGMDADQRWLDRSPQIMLETFHWFRGEGFDLIVEDLLRLPVEPVVVEGFRLLPHLVAPLLTAPAQAVWLLPTPGFREAAFERRGGPRWEVVAGTSDPPAALRNLLERDRLFTERLRAQALGLGLAVVEVETTTTEDDLAEQIAARLGL